MRIHSAPMILVCIAGCIGAAPTPAAAAGKRLTKKPTYDPAASVVELFEGIEQNKIDAKLIPKSSLAGVVFIENKSDRPITVKLPQAITAVQVLKQGFGGGAGAGAGGSGGRGGGAGQGGQSVGGGFGGGGGGGQQGGAGGGFGGAGGNAGGGGFFTIPPDRSVQIPLTCVCLNHGKAEPLPKMSYRLVPLETYTSDPALQELLKAVGSGDLDPGMAQAATWHLTDHLSWDKLSQKMIDHVGGADPEHYFSEVQIAGARQLVADVGSKSTSRTQNAAPSPTRIRESAK